MVSLFISACGGGGTSGGSTPTPTPTPSVASIAISPPTASIAADTTQQFTATAKDGGGNTLSGVAFTWSSGSTNVATINSGGLASGVAAGTAQINASSGGVVSPSAVLSVSGVNSGPRWVQTVELSCHTGGPGPQCATTVPVSITAKNGNTILLAFWYNSLATTVTVGDSNNDTFRLWEAVPTADLNDSYGFVYSAMNVAGGQTTVNISFASNIPTSVYGAALEYSGVTSGTDTTITSNALLTSEPQSIVAGIFTAHFSNELVFGLALADFGVKSNSWVPRVGCTPQSNDTPPNYYDSGNFCLEESTATTPGSYEAQFTTDFSDLGSPPSSKAPDGYGAVGFSVY
jgi:hypothetical protein